MAEIILDDGNISGELVESGARGMPKPVHPTVGIHALCFVPGMDPSPHRGPGGRFSVAEEISVLPVLDKCFQHGFQLGWDRNDAPLGDFPQDGEEPASVIVGRQARDLRFAEPAVSSKAHDHFQPLIFNPRPRVFEPIPIERSLVTAFLDPGPSHTGGVSV